ncbi:hypothetical protein NMG60_11008914 [Bertholletia excelsa]
MAKKASNGDKIKSSVCEKSMQMIVTIIKLSSVSLAGVTLGSTIARPNLPSPGQQTVKEVVSSSNLLRQTRSKKPETDSISQSCVMDPGDTRGSSYVVSQIKDKDERVHRNKESPMNGSVSDVSVSDFINWFHEKNRQDSINASTGVPFIVPPPPPPHSK